MNAALSVRSVDASLAEIDERTQDGQQLAQGHTAIGLFGVLNIDRMSREPAAEPILSATAPTTLDSA